MAQIEKMRKNKKGLKKILKILEEEDDFLITSHIWPDGDAIGSQLALGLFLERMGKHYRVVSQDPLPPTYSFLPITDQISSPQEVQRSFKVACVLDCFEFKRLGKDIAPLVKSCQRTLNIDHHPGESEFGGPSLSLPSYSSTSEILYELLNSSLAGLDQEIALCLYTGILADTGSFGYTNVTSKTHLVVADLLDYGLDVAKISNLVYKIDSPKLIKLLSLVLGTITLESEGKIAYVFLTHKKLNELGLERAFFEAEFVLRHIRRLEGVKGCLFFYEVGKKEIKVSLRSNPGLDVNRVARTFGGGGHQRSAGCVIYNSLEMAIQECLSEAKRNL